MKLFNFLMVIFLLAGVPCGTLAQENAPILDTYFLHTVEKGQSLYSIASMYHVNQADIIALNPGCEEKIYAGRTLKIPQKKEKGDPVFHTIQPQETLYQLTVKYHIPAEDICKANPGLSASNFKIGEVIIIPSADKGAEKQTSKSPLPAKENIRPEVKPRCKEMHKVQRKETIFSVSRQYGITEQELINANPELKRGMKKGDLLCIPYPETTPEIPKEEISTPMSNADLFNSSKKLYKKYVPVKAAVILPFLNKSNKAESSRMIEYYEGFLMAVDSLKKKGVSIDLYTYDSGTTKNSIQAILSKKEMKDMHIIFGPVHAEQIKPLADFARKNDIQLVIPFSSKGSEVFNNPSVYQINTPQSYLYSEVYEHFIRKFNNANVIILETNDVDKDKQEFIKGLKQELKNKRFTCTSLKADATQAAMKAALDPNRENLLVLNSGSNIALIKTLPSLTLLVKENPEVKIHLFGYPEWQTYTKDHLASFYELDTYFYSSFYTNNLFPQALNFTSAYRKWYGKDMANTYPKYGMLGFDTAYFFLYGLSRYGNDFPEDVNKLNVVPIQTGFKFDRVNNWGGFINKKVFFVHFTKDFELVKLDFD